MLLEKGNKVCSEATESTDRKMLKVKQELDIYLQFLMVRWAPAVFIFCFRFTNIYDLTQVADVAHYRINKVCACEPNMFVGCHEVRFQILYHICCGICNTLTIDLKESWPHEKEYGSSSYQLAHFVFEMPLSDYQ